MTEAADTLKGPLVYQQLQSLILEIPKWVNSFMVFVQNVPDDYPDLVSSDQITTFLQSLSGQITAISQDFLKALRKSCEIAVI